MRFWLLLGIIYGSFFLWYTDLGGKLNDDEIQSFLNKLEENGINEYIYNSMKIFMEQDSGKQFLMVNNIHMSVDPSADEFFRKYNEHMIPELLSRACHPTFFGSSVHQAMDIVGIDNAADWDTAVLMRYKSRRAFMEVVSNPELKGKHEFKIVALEKTIAYPVEPNFYLSDLRIIFGFIFMIFGLLIRPIRQK